MKVKWWRIKEVGKELMFNRTLGGISDNSKMIIKMVKVCK